VTVAHRSIPSLTRERAVGFADAETERVVRGDQDPSSMPSMWENARSLALEQPVEAH
jgi:hypothetical protein